MLLLRETHEVIGAKESLFEETMRDEWLPALARTDDARLLYSLNLAVGSGRSYQVVIYPLFRAGAPWGRAGAACRVERPVRHCGSPGPRHGRRRAATKHSPTQWPRASAP